MDRSNNRTMLLVIVSALLITGSQGANILGVFTSLSPSHLIIQMSVAKILAENGHNVTVITALKPPVNHKDITVVQIPLSEEDSLKMSSTIGSMAMRDNSNMITSMFRSISQMGFMYDKMKDVIKDQRARNIYENPDHKFDLVLFGYFLNNYQLGIAHKMKVPMIMVASMPPNEMFNSMFGIPNAFSYVPMMTQPAQQGHALTFLQRIKNLVSIMAMKVFFSYLDYNNANAYKEIFGDYSDMPNYNDLTRNISLGFFSSHALSEGPVRPIVPAVIEVGGIQIKDTPAPLPKFMESFLDKATHGAILLSLGSNVKGEHIKPDTVHKMFNVLSKLKERVIWKWEDLEHTPGKSPNILYSQWLPQDDILAHPKVKLFITHAGKGGITESQYHGKPMLALPIFGDQPSNAEKMVRDGFGLSLSLLTLEEQPFHESLVEILENPQYTQKVKAFSSLYRDRPMTARQSVLYWTEYVLRHHGAPHLQSPLVHMNFIAANNLDLFAMLATVLIVFICISKFILGRISRKLRCKSKIVKKIKKH